MIIRLKLRPWPVRVWRAYKVYRQLGKPFWALKSAVRIAFPPADGKTP